MTHDEWTRVRELFDAALTRRSSERAAFLDETCAGSPSLRAEVASLLDAHDRAADFIEAPAYEVAAHLFADAIDHPVAGRAVGPYIIRHEIGRGGMGVVYLADDTRLSRRVALKAIVPGTGSDATRRARMRQEARAAAALSHPGIATVYALEEIGEELYLACEYVPGRTLRALIESERLALPQVVDIAVQLARALAAAHAQGVVHRDLKPENVVRSGAGVVKVLDFGIARMENAAGARLTPTGDMIGTPAYMAPEQIRRQRVDFRTDLFALGLLVYEMASGSNPFEADTATATIARILEVDPLPLSQVSGTGLPALDRIVALCLRKDAESRYASAERLVADLEHLQAQLAEHRDDAPAELPRAGGSAIVESRTRSAQWWWEFHQVAVSMLYVSMMYPAWRARAWLPASWGTFFFFAVLAAVATSTTVRLHLRFTARVYPAELAVQRSRALGWTRVSDAGFSLALLLAAIGIEHAHPEIATLLVTVSIAAAVASFTIEPATTRAAFAQHPSASTLEPPRRARRTQR